MSFLGRFFKPPTGPEAIAQLMQRCCVQASSRKIGIEVERIGMWPDGTTLKYAAQGKHAGARDILEELGKQTRWKAKLGPNEEPLGFHSPTGTLSLEPGSQLEFSADPVPSLVEMESGLWEMESRIDSITHPQGLRWIGLGVNPVASIENQDIIPLKRYHIMNDYFSRTGALGRAMMRLTSSLQFNFDYCSEASAVRMLRASAAAVPISYALFSNSPLYEGKVTPFLSFRSEIWRHTDPARTGILPEVFEKDFGFLKYARRLWNMPLMYCEDDAGFIVPGQGKSLAQIHEGALHGVSANDANLRFTLAQSFTEARWKTGYIEIRSVDGLGPKYRMAAAAFWTGLLYEEDTSEWLIEELGFKLSEQERLALSIDASKLGLATRVRTTTLADIGTTLLERCHRTLAKRGLQEERFLEPLKTILETRRSPAQEVLEFWNKEGDIGALIESVSLPPLQPGQRKINEPLGNVSPC